MGFATALSGLSAASADLKTTGNNIANANTVGFKRSRAEFADVYANSVGGVSTTQTGSGVRVTDVSQQFSQGVLEFTENSLDVALNGNGFFSVANSVDATRPNEYTRAGAFQLNRDGFVVNDDSQYLLAFAPNGKTLEEGFSQGVFEPLQIDTSQGLPNATSKVNAQLNLNSDELSPTVVPFDPNDPNSFNSTTSAPIYDSQGNAHTLSTYYVYSDPVNNTWEAYVYIDDVGFRPDGTAETPLVTPVTLEFGNDGFLSNVNGAAPAVTNVDFGPIVSTDIDPNLTVDDLNFNLSYGNSTQYNATFSVNEFKQDGLPSGNLTGISISNEGVVFANYSNGGAKPLGQLALARFPSDSRLNKIGDSNWAESVDSGQPVFGVGGSNNFGTVKSASLEGSNVDLASQLVRLIVAQQAYQANAEVISTEDTVTQTILNIR